MKLTHPRTWLALTAITAAGIQTAHAAINETFFALTIQTTVATDTAAPISLVSYTYNGSTLVQNNSFAVPSIDAGANLALTLTSLTGQHDGMLRLSGDGKSLTFGGYHAAPGSANPQNSSAAVVNRVIGSFNLATGTFNTSQALTDAYNFAPFVAVATQNGNAFWTGGSLGFNAVPSGNNFDLSGGVRFAAAGSSTTTNIGLTQALGQPLQPDSVRSILIADNNVYITTASQNSYKVQGADGNLYLRGTYQVGTNLPITQSTAAPVYKPVLNGLESGTLAGQEVVPDSKGSWVPKSDVVFLDLNPLIPGNDTAYGTGGKNEYQKWAIVDVGGGILGWKQVTIWDLSVSNGGAGITDINGLAAFVQPGGLVDIFATADGGIYHFTDNNTQTGFITTNASISYAATLAGSQFRGIAAVPEPATAALLALGGMLLVRRRRTR